MDINAARLQENKLDGREANREDILVKSDTLDREDAQVRADA